MTDTERIVELTCENDLLRGLTARLMPCRYCGVDDMTQCPSGFPGCGLGDDLMAFDATLTALWREKIAMLEAEAEKAAKVIAAAVEIADSVGVAGRVSRFRKLCDAVQTWRAEK